MRGWPHAQLTPEIEYRRPPARQPSPDPPRTPPRVYREAPLASQTPRKLRRQPDPESRNRTSATAQSTLLSTPYSAHQIHRHAQSSSTRRQQLASSLDNTAARQQVLARLVNADALEVQVRRETGLKLYAMKKQKRKDIWHFARLIPKAEFCQLEDEAWTNDHAGQCICLLCKTKQTFRVGKHKMVEHVTQQHPVEWKAYLTQRNLSVTADGAVTAQRVARRLDDMLMTVADANTPPIREITTQEQRMVNQLLAKWIARHFRPMIMVEDKGFIEFIFFITHELGRVNLNLPKRTQLRQDIVTLAVRYRRLVKTDIRRFCLYFSVTSDIWTGRDGRSYISLTAHYVTPTFESRNWTLEVRELPGIHDGPAIATSLSEMMVEWELPRTHCSNALRDGGANMVNAAERLGISHMDCIAHSLHLVVAGALIKKTKKKDRLYEEPAWAADVNSESDESIPENQEDEMLSEEDRENMDGVRDLAIDEMDEFLDATILNLERNDLDCVRETVQHFRTLAVYFRKSPQGQKRLDACQIKARGVKPSEVLRIQMDCPTRWNSCWDMLQRLLVLEHSLIGFFAYLKSSDGRTEFKDMEAKLRRPQSSEWLSIKCLSTLLAPFAVATEALSGQKYPTMPLVLPALSGIRKHLSRTDLFAADMAVAGEEPYVNETEVMMNGCRKIILKLFNQRFLTLESSDLVWIAYLDPRVGKRMSHLHLSDRQSACDKLITAASELAEESILPRAEGIQAGNHQTVQVAQEVRSFMEDYMFGPDLVPAQQTDLKADCEDEFTLYLSDIKSVKSKDDPFQWWRVNGSKYPNLSRLARKWLGAVATSVPSERAFSTSGNTLTAKRSSLTPSMVRDLVFIAQNSSVDELGSSG